jgi:hypothetical protein
MNRPTVMPPAEPPTIPSDGVAPGVELGQLVAGQVPVLAQLAAAAHMADSEDAAQIQKRQPAGDEVWIFGDAVGAVDAEQHGG